LTASQKYEERLPETLAETKEMEAYATIEYEDQAGRSSCGTVRRLAFFKSTREGRSKVFCPEWTSPTLAVSLHGRCKRS
jgi:hypothetical protein